MHTTDSTPISTVSLGFINDWLEALHGYCPADQMASFLRRAGLDDRQHQANARVTLDQIVRLYQIAAVETDDEMMGLWGRPIRSGALKHLLTTVREASTLPSALYRFSTFWNLLLDDFRFELRTEGGQLCLHLIPRQNTPVQRFGHMLILKLSHGLISWLAGHEVPVEELRFAFPPPEFATDYPFIFPAPVLLGASHSMISYDSEKLGAPVPRNNAELLEFLRRAPRDWIFTSYREHTYTVQLRELIYRFNWNDCSLADMAQALNLTSRTLMRRLDAESTSFQSIKDGLRRDIAIGYLQDGRKNIEEISQDVGFSSAANFHRAFRRWTGVTPSKYRTVLSTSARPVVTASWLLN